MPRIKWVEESDARASWPTCSRRPVQALISGIRREHVPDILRTMSHRPDFLAAIMDASRMHFSDGALTRAQHEMIASYVSALNKCHY